MGRERTGWGRKRHDGFWGDGRPCTACTGDPAYTIESAVLALAVVRYSGL